jgi:hypothetical protein
MEKLKPIPVKLKPDKVMKMLHTDNGDLVQSLIDKTSPLIEAQALFKTCYVEEKSEGAVVIDGVRFNSIVLRKHLENVGRVFTWVLTIGPQLEEQADACDDLLEKFYLDAMGNLALRTARKYLESHLRSKYALEKVSCMSPGSLADWPIQEQKPLFSLLDGVEETVGVKLNNSMLMIPRKSVSGIYFPTETSFFSCQLCPRERCEGRKAKYNEQMAREYGILNA